MRQRQGRTPIGPLRALTGRLRGNGTAGPAVAEGDSSGHRAARERNPADTRRRRWAGAAWAVLIVGLGASAGSGLSWAHYEHARAAKTFDATASGVASTVASGLRRDLDFETSLRGMVATFPGLTNHLLAPWFRSLHVERRYPGSLGFVFVQPVPSTELPAFVATMEQDPLVGTSGGTFTVLPTGTRAQYCLARLGFLASSAPIAPGFDLCAPVARGKPTRTMHSVLSTVDSGNPVVLGDQSLVALRGRRLPHGLFVVVDPVYRGGTAPGTVAGRRAAFMGVVIGAFSTTGLVGPALAGAPGFAVTVSAGEGPLGGNVGAGGTSHRGDPQLVRTVSTTPAFRVRVTGPALSAGLAEGLVVGGGGAAFSFVVFLLLSHLGRSRERALRMVEERTGELQHQALHDAVTGLPNRVLLFDRAAQMLARARRRPLAVGALYVDLDNFKDVNDSLGHQVGDELLRAVGTRLARSLRPSDTVGRLGGDEFLVLVEGDTFDAGPELVAERLQAVLAEPFTLESPEPVNLVVQASIGVAVGRRGSADDLIRDADVALYQAKAAGKGRYVVFRPEMQTAVHDRLALEMDLRQALDDGDQLGVVYQPIFDLASLTPKGVEALVRWHHPARGVLQPASFVPVAEDCGLIVPIGRLVLEQACTHAAGWHRQGHAVTVSVNVSAVQLEVASFADDVRRAIRRSGLEPWALTLEITETSLMRDTDLTVRVLATLKDLGVRLSIDDFGTGYSSLGYLRQFPIDAIKIDRSFIARAGQTVESGALLHSLVRLGQTLGIETLAEGIEERAQLDRLQQERCDSGQGFLLSRPLEAGEVASLFDRYRSATAAVTAR